jgi:transcriptional regulator of acetoin/glycerol metabolism
VALADDGACITLDDLPPEFRCRLAEPPPPVPEPEPDGGPAEAAEVPVPLATLTRQAVEQAILAHHGNMTAAARALGLHRSTLYRILQRPVG